MFNVKYMLFMDYVEAKSVAFFVVRKKIKFDFLARFFKSQTLLSASSHACALIYIIIYYVVIFRSELRNGLKSSLF